MSNNWSGTQFLIPPHTLTNFKIQKHCPNEPKFNGVYGRTHFIRNIHVEFGIPKLLQSPDIGQNSDGVFSDFRISGQSLVKVNCHNSKTSDDIGMKPKPVTKRDKRNKNNVKKINDEVMSVNCDVIVIFLSYGQFGAIRKPSSGRIVCKTYISINWNLLSYENWKQN